MTKIIKSKILIVTGLFTLILCIVSAYIGDYKLDVDGENITKNR